MLQSHVFVVKLTFLTEGVGKSTIITSLIKESYVAHASLFPSVISLFENVRFFKQVQKVIPEVTIPPEVTPENITTYIVDTGSTSRLLRILDESRH